MSCLLCVLVCVCVSDAAVAMFSVQLCYFERRDAVRRAQSSTARMRVAIILGCTALLIAATAIARGFGLQVFLRISWDGIRIFWNALLFSGTWIVPHWLNHITFWVVRYCVWGILWALNFVLMLWESSFDLGMRLMGQQPSASAKGLTQLIAHPLRASGVSCLIHIIGEQFQRVPQVFADFGSSHDNIPNAVFTVAMLACIIECIYANRGRYRNYDRIVQATLESFIPIVMCLLLSDLVVFALLISATLLPLLCIFAALALASFGIYCFRPSIRPKHSAPCMALLAALYAIFAINHPNNLN